MSTKSLVSEAVWCTAPNFVLSVHTYQHIRVPQHFPQKHGFLNRIPMCFLLTVHTLPVLTTRFF